MVGHILPHVLHSRLKPLCFISVTGSSRGIGAGAVIRLAEHGADVVINYFSSPQPAEGVAEQCRSYGVRALVIQADVSKREDLVKLFDQTVHELGHLDIVFSNAGIEHWGKPDEVDEAQIDKVSFSRTLMHVQNHLEEIALCRKVCSGGGY